MSSCMKQQRIPKQWRVSTVIAIKKPNKPANNPGSYRPISLLSVTLKVFERVILRRITPYIDICLPNEQAGFRKGRSTVDQIISLTEDIECAFERNEKAGAVFIDLSAAYDTVWIKGLTFKLLQCLPSPHMIRLIIDIFSNRRLRVQLGGKLSRARRLNNGLPQGSVLSPLLFNLYTSDIPLTSAKKYIYADDMAILSTGHKIAPLSKTLSADISILSGYFKKWHLRLNIDKTVVSLFHLNNHQVDATLTVSLDGTRLPNVKHPTYLGVTLDRTLSYRQHIESISGKVRSRCNIIRRLAGINWGSSFHTLRTSVLALCYSAAEYAAPVWSGSTHVKKVDASLNEAMRLISGAIRPTPIDLLPVLSGIPPADIRRDAICVSASRSLNTLPIPVVKPRLKSRHPFSRRVRTLLNLINTNGIDELVCRRWQQRWEKSTSQLRRFVPNVSLSPIGNDLTRSHWVQLNRLRSGYGRYRGFLFKAGLVTSPNCDCGVIQTGEHILACPTINIQGSMKEVNAEFRQWIGATTCRF